MRHLGKTAPGGGPEIGAASSAGPDRIPNGRPYPRRARRGLINVILTVAIVAVVLFGLLSLYGGINRSIKTQTLQTHVITAEAAVRQTYASAQEFPAQMTATVVNKMPPSAIREISGALTMVTPWGGRILVRGGNTLTAGAVHGTRFHIIVEGLSTPVCESLAESYLNRSSVEVVRTAVSQAAAFATRADAAAVAGGCTGDDVNRVGIVFRG